MRNRILLSLGVGIVLLAAPQHTAAKDKVLMFSLEFVTKAEGKDQVISQPILVTLEGRPCRCFTGGMEFVTDKNGRMKVEVGNKVQVVAWPRAVGRFWLEVDVEKTTVSEKEEELLKAQRRFAGLVKEGERITIRLDGPGLDKPVWVTIIVRAKDD